MENKSLISINDKIFDIESNNIDKINKNSYFIHQKYNKDINSDILSNKSIISKINKNKTNLLEGLTDTCISDIKSLSSTSFNGIFRIKSKIPHLSIKSKHLLNLDKGWILNKIDTNSLSSILMCDMNSCSLYYYNLDKVYSKSEESFIQTKNDYISAINRNNILNNIIGYSTFNYSNIIKIFDIIKRKNVCELILKNNINNYITSISSLNYIFYSGNNEGKVIFSDIRCKKLINEIKNNNIENINLTNKFNPINSIKIKNNHLLLVQKSNLLLFDIRLTNRSLNSNILTKNKNLKDEIIVAEWSPFQENSIIFGNIGSKILKNINCNENFNKNIVLNLKKPLLNILSLPVEKELAVIENSQTSLSVSFHNYKKMYKDKIIINNDTIGMSLDLSKNNLILYGTRNIDIYGLLDKNILNK